MMTPREGFQFAIDTYGSQKLLGDAIGYRQGAVSRAFANEWPTAEMAHNIAVVTKNQVKREYLRPDLFEGDCITPTQLIKHSWSRAHHRKGRHRKVPR